VNETRRSLAKELLITPPMLYSASVASAAKGWSSAKSRSQLRSVELGAGEDKIELCEIQQEPD
jgi:hypothetical protein